MVGLCIPCGVDEKFTMCEGRRSLLGPGCEGAKNDCHVDCKSCMTDGCSIESKEQSADENTSSVMATSGGVRKPIVIPNIDLWALLFEQNDRTFSEDQGMAVSRISSDGAEISLVIYRCFRDHRSYTYSAVKQSAEWFGNGLIARWSWQTGDVLTIFSPNSIDTPIIVYGTIWAGGVVAQANPSYTVRELADQLIASGSKVLVTHCDNLQTAIRASHIANLPRSKVLLVGNRRDQSGQSAHFSSLLLYRDAERQRAVLDPRSDLAFLVFSSGTTGLPKGVMLTHSNVVSNLLILNSVEGTMLKSGEDKILSILPYYHVYGMSMHHVRKSTHP